MSLNIRSVLELLCAILSENDVTRLKAESFRQAKFNEDRATDVMWKALFDTIKFYEAMSTTVLNKNHCDINPADTVRYVKSNMQKWGYLSKSFAELSEDMTTGSRELLLALGWLIHSRDIIDKMISHRSSPLHKNIDTFKALPDCSGLLPHSLNTPSRSLSARQQLQRQLMLSGKLRMSLRRLYASLQQAAKLKQEIHCYTKDISLQPELDHLTPLEVYLLRYPNSMKEMYQEIGKDNAQLKNLLEWKGKDHVFWEWMDSVLSLHIEEAKTCGKAKQESEATETVFLPVPVSIADDISRLRTQLRDFILKHEEDMYQLDRILANKKVSHEELEISTYESEKELAELTKKFSENVISREEDHTFNTSSSQHTDTLLHRLRNSTVRNPASTSIQSMKKNKKAEIIGMVKEEIGVLQQKVVQLETELKETQLENVHKFQSIMSENESSIFILPRYFKQFANI